MNTRREELQRGKITAEKLSRVHHLCSQHFEESQFMNAQQKNRLIWNAVPTLFDVPNPPSKMTIKRKLPDFHPDTSLPQKRKRTEGKYIDSYRYWLMYLGPFYTYSSLKKKKEMGEQDCVLTI